MSDADPAITFNPFDLTHGEDPYPRLALLRRLRPISTPLPGWRVLVRDADVRSVIAGSELWSSRRNNPGVPLTREADRQLALSQLDPPAHKRLRRAFGPAFARAAIESLEQAVRRQAECLAAALSTRLRAEGAADLVRDFAAPLPRGVIAAFTGVASDDVADHQRWTSVFGDLVGYRQHAEWPRFHAWALRVARDPGRLQRAPVRACLEPLASARAPAFVHEEEIVTLLHFLIVAGVANVRHALGNLVYRLLQAGAWPDLGAGALDVSRAIEESLRLDPPALWQMRTATRDTELAGSVVREGERVIAVVASANRDEAAWPEADRFWPERAGVRKHLAFGRGPHTCLGADLTRLELRVALEVLARELPALQLAPGFRYRRAGDFMTRGPAELAVCCPASRGRVAPSNGATEPGPAASPARAHTPHERWFRCPDPRPLASIALVCCPHAGGSAAFFHAWSRLLPASIELCAVQYPGRLDRLAEPCATAMLPLADALTAALLDQTSRERELVLFGHSMGASLAFELALRLEREGRPPVRQLWVSGRPGPRLQNGGTIHQRDDAGLLAELERLGGTQGELLGNAEMRALLLPALRADYRLIETYRPDTGARVRCPIIASGGDSDPEASPNDLDAWADATEATFSRTLLPGGHFYLARQTRPLLSRLLAALGLEPALDPQLRSLP